MSKVFRPTLAIARYFAAAIVFGLAASLILHPHNFMPLAVALIVAAIPSAMLLGTKLTLGDDAILTYSAIGYRQSVDLKQLTGCSYHYKRSPGAKSLPYAVFQLTDSTGATVTFPANTWLNRNLLYDAIKQAVTDRNVILTDKTAAKLGTSTNVVPGQN